MQENRNYLAVLTYVLYILVTAESLHSPLKNIKKDNSFGYSKRLR